MNNLTKGANAFLTNSGIIRVNIHWKSRRANLEVVCFSVMANGRVSTDEWFLFYNQPRSPGSAIHFSRQPGSSEAEFVINLDKLPADIQKCVFAAVLDQGSFQEVTDATITASPQAGEGLTFKIAGASDQQAMIFAEIYRRNSTWKMRAIGQGFKGGLKSLAEYHGVAIAEEQPTPSPLPSPPTREIPPIPPVPPVPNRRRSGFFRKVTVFSIVALLVVGASVVALNYYYPQLMFLLSPRLSSLLRPVAGPSLGDAQPKKDYVAPTCPFTDEQVFDRYHALGENYVRILKLIDSGNENLAKAKDELRTLEAECPPLFKEKNAKEIERLEKLPIHGWIDEATRLNICAGIMIKKVESELNNESRPNIIQRLLKNADRSRNLESDLTNISRDLAYLNNKMVRLIEGYKSNLEACLK